VAAEHSRGGVGVGVVREGVWRRCCIGARRVTRRAELGVARNFEPWEEEGASDRGVVVYQRARESRVRTHPVSD